MKTYKILSTERARREIHPAFWPCLMASCMGAWCKRSARLMSQPASRSNWAISRLLFRTASVTKSTERTFTEHSALHHLCHKINKKDIHWTFSSAPPLSQNQQKRHSLNIQLCTTSVTKSTKRTFTEHSALHHLCHKINKKDIHWTFSSAPPLSQNQQKRPSLNIQLCTTSVTKSTKRTFTEHPAVTGESAGMWVIHPAVTGQSQRRWYYNYIYTVCTRSSTTDLHSLECFKRTDQRYTSMCT